ncbi:hypothetical protein [Haloarchaeobius sp. HRN-SO-5]|uniref:hypothetical protein n=1 Tax=Haloarchaeobius sp. HRN-SO-5 TaxID=3446118 RepID=UPI003EBD104B
MGDTKRGRERKHLNKESQVLERDIEYAKRVARGEVSEEPPRVEEDDIELDLDVADEARAADDD